MFNSLDNNIQPVSEPTSSKIENFKITDHAKKITVRVSGENRFGSGILVSRRETGNPNLNGYYYLVLTCYHNVLPDSSAKSKNFYVFTSDNIGYPASLFRNKEQRLFSDIDMDFLYFYSPSNLTYELAKPAKPATIKPNDRLIVAGYPCEGDGCPNINNLTLTPGIATTIEKPLKNGYQLGFSGDFKEGTSGGPVLNNNGQLVGIAGKRKGIYNNSNQQYTYMDKSLPSNQQIEEYKNLAWALTVDENTFTLSDKLFQNASFQNTISQKENTDSSKNLEKLMAIYSEVKPYFLYLNISIIILLSIITMLLIALCYLLIFKSPKRS